MKCEKCGTACSAVKQLWNTGAMYPCAVPMPSDTHGVQLDGMGPGIYFLPAGAGAGAASGVAVGAAVVAAVPFFATSRINCHLVSVVGRWSL
jgi:hypothetical protein